MEQILRKLSEIETTADEILKDAERKKQALPKRRRDNVKSLMPSWKKKPTQKSEIYVMNWKKKRIHAWQH